MSEPVQACCVCKYGQYVGIVIDMYATTPGYECRANPPKIRWFARKWPEVNGQDWCGRWEPRDVFDEGRVPPRRALEEISNE